ncbi:hypothetical protein [Mesobacillus sp.]|uniref:hypothetical protein n=1 Tax=Mesobacillus sp. TaxID=2675271 RepID=UPI0039EF7EA0
MRGEKLSEVRVTSDRFGPERRKAVRSRIKFGQVWAWEEKSCQKQDQVRTASASKERSSPKQEWADIAFSNILLITSNESYLLAYSYFYERIVEVRRNARNEAG